MILERFDIAEGSLGPWTVSRFTVGEKEAVMQRINALKYGHSVPEGTYTQLLHARRGLIMSDTPDEMRDHWEPVFKARGHVLLNGLGIGMVLRAILKKPEVSRVTVVEIDPDVIALVGPHYACDRLEIVQADAAKYQPPTGIRYGVVWHDIWDAICSDNIPEMSTLKRKYGRRADWQGCWAEHRCRRYA